MNKVIMMGRLVAEPKFSYAQKDNALAISRYRIAVGRKSKKEGETPADFFNCVVFGKSAEFARQYLHKGTQICISGHLQSGSYINKENKKVFTIEIVVEETTFAGPKQENATSGNMAAYQQAVTGGFPQNNMQAPLGYQVGAAGAMMPQAGYQAPANVASAQSGYGNQENAGMNRGGFTPSGNMAQSQDGYYAPNTAGYMQNQSQGMASKPGCMIPPGTGFMDIPKGIDEALPY